MTKILLVEDAEVLRELEHSCLDRADCRLLTASDGPGLLAAARRERPALVFLDVKAPGASGLELCRAIKEDPALRGTRVVFVALPVEHDRCKEAGADGFVSRPPSRQRLLEAVRRFVALVERSGPRLAIALRVDYRGPRGQEGFAFTRDLAGEGLFLKTREPFAIGEAVELRFSLPVPGGRPVLATGRVVWKSPLGGDPEAPAGIGIAFDRLSPSDHLEIGRFVRERAGGAP